MLSENSFADFVQSVGAQLGSYPWNLLCIHFKFQRALTNACFWRLREVWRRHFAEPWNLKEKGTFYLSNNHSPGKDKERLELAVDLGKYILESLRITKVWVGEDSFDEAWLKFWLLKDKPLSFIDCISIALVEKSGI